MTIWTWAQIKEKVANDLDLNGEVFVGDEELLGYGNAALEEAEKEVMTLYSKYFETETNLSLVSGTSVYALPTDIYAVKITLIQYSDGATKYKIRPLKNLDEIAFVQENDAYRYRIINAAAQGFRIKLYPPSRETSTSNVTVHYLRTVARFEDDADTLEIPEAAQFIIQHMKDAILNKEVGPTNSTPPSPALEKQRELFRSVLGEMKDDLENEIEPDTSFYEEFDSYDLIGDY